VRSLAVCAARDDRHVVEALFILGACATFTLHATSQKNYRRFFPGRVAFRPRAAGASRRVVRQQDQENLRAHADAGTAETSQELDRIKEERGRREIAHAKTISHSGKISVAFAVEKEEGVRESDARRFTGAERLRFIEEKEEIFTRARTGDFPWRVTEKEAQTFFVADSNPITWRISESDPKSRSERNSEGNTFAVSIREKERRPRHDRGEGHRRL